MKTDYTPDNTRSSIVILFSSAIIVAVIAAFIGLADKPDVSTIVITPAGESPAISVPASTFGFGSEADTSNDATDSNASDVLTNELGQPIDSSDTNAGGTSDTGTESRVPEGDIIVVPTLEPTPTPEVAAAVAPTPIPVEADESDSGASTAGSPSLPTTSGTVQGTFFTRADENDGAIVSQNLITVSFAEDGSGSFQGVLDITYLDGTHILLNMSGPLTWAASNPQVEATVDGAFTLDAPIDTDDVVANDASLSISSLEAGSGSLCTTRCFGFTFPPQS